MRWRQIMAKRSARTLDFVKISKQLSFVSIYLAGNDVASLQGLMQKMNAEVKVLGPLTAANGSL